MSKKLGMKSFSKAFQHPTAEVFFFALKAMPRKEQDALFNLMAEDKDFRHDILDIALSIERLKEPCKPLKVVLQEIKASSKKRA